MSEFVTVLADPPWSYGDKLRMDPLINRSSEDHYDVMSLDEICDLRHEECIAGFDVADTAFLWLWVTNSFLLDGSGARVARAWGFEPKQLVTWVKTKKDVEDPKDGSDLACGMGRITRGATEHMIVATRGKYSHLVKAKNLRNVIFAPRTRHSEKPEESFQLIEAVTPGPYLELFARRRRNGWVCWGKELSAP